MPVKLTRNQIIIISIAGAVLLFFILLFTGVIPGRKTSPGGSIGGGGGGTKLTFWGVIEDTPLKQAIEDYQKINRDVNITYTQFDSANYEKELLNALAAGRGPDIFMLHNAWLPKHYDKILALTETQFPLTQFRQLYPTVAEQDFILTDKETGAASIFALPLYIDTLALLYNRDVFDAKGIVLPPANWQEVQNIIPQLREINPATNEIRKAAAAIGGSEQSVNGAADLLSLLMLQSGSPMIDSKSDRADFGDAGLNALNFYVQFANPLSSSYTWNDNFRYSLDSFADGNAAVIFNYASSIPYLKSKNPYLNIGVAAMPQLNKDRPVNYANYWGLTVSSQSRNSAAAWNFILYLTANSQASEQFIKSSRLPPALRVLISQYLNDPNLSVFARQSLTARSWHQVDSSVIKKIFSDMIKSVLSGKLSTDNALKEAENEINELRK